MARSSFILACVSLAVLVLLTQELHSAECRHLKLRKKNHHEFRKVLLQTPTKIPGNEMTKIAKRSGNLPSSPVYFVPATPGHSLGVGHSLEHTLPKPHGLYPNDNGSPTNQPGYFRPTTPGNSPGIGHPLFAPKDGAAKENSSPDDFKPISLDHTQGGAGHSIDRRMEDNESPDNQPDYFRPTTPGHSPGIGHHFSATSNGAVKDLNDFTLTTHSQSPSVGHSLGQSLPTPSSIHPKDVESPPNERHSPGIGHVSSASSNGGVMENSFPGGFGATNPGHSLSVGHSLQN
ncbi:precursor of CEP9-like [Malania oleifera]|uniref:precursor of CEP9-like n=1 Tax=Malania oleifera TaxID=397392 RepID=UPI0025AE7B60|nr:precursor of CEP9-like [Malania oleifera]